MFDLGTTVADRAAPVEPWASGFVAVNDLNDEHRRWMVELDGDGYT